MTKHLLKENFWFKNPLKDLNLVADLENWQHVYQDEGKHILYHNEREMLPIRSVYWQKIARRIVRQKSLNTHPLSKTDELARIIGIQLNVPNLEKHPDKYGLVYKLNLSKYPAIHHFDVLANCYNVRELLLFNTKIKNLKPLSSLNQLRNLYCSNTSIKDISPLKNLKNLTRLYLAQSPVKDLRPLANLTQLEHLDLEDTAIESIEMLKKLVNLTELRISATAVTNISVLSNMTKLRRLGLWNTNISDLSPLRTLHQLQILWAEKMPVKDIQVLAEMESLRHARLDGALVEDWTPLLKAKNLNEVVIYDKAAKEKARTQLAGSHLKIG